MLKKGKNYLLQYLHEIFTYKFYILTVEIEDIAIFILKKISTRGIGESKFTLSNNFDIIYKNSYP